MNQWLQLRRLRGPAYLILLGIMFLLAEWHIISFHRSWPLLLILAGLLSLAERAALARVDPGQLTGGVPGTYPGAYTGYPAQSYQPPAYSGSVVPPPAVSTELAPPTTGTISSDRSEQGPFEQGRS